MSSVEERLVQDIAAVTGGVVMTDSELRDARNALDGRIAEQHQPRRRAAIVAGVAAAAVVAVLGVVAFQTIGDDEKTAPGPATPERTPADPTPDPDADFLTGSTPTAELLQGVWRIDNGSAVILFDGAGRVSFDDQGQLFDGPVTQGTYVLEGDQINVTVDQGPAGCEGRELVMRASIAGRGAIRFVGSGFGTGDCSPLRDGRVALEHVLPTDFEGLSTLVLSTEPGFETVEERSALHGFWMAEGGGHVLEIDPDGSYYVADQSAEPIDQGQWSWQSSELTLTSSAASTACGEGDQLVWAGQEQVDIGPTTGMRQTLQGDSCGAAWAEKTWIKIPQLG